MVEETITNATVDKAKTGYKKTKLGWIPEEWKYEKIASVAKVDPESLGTKTSDDYLFRYVSLSDIKGNKISNDLEVYLYANSPSRARRIVKLNDVLLATVRPNLKAFAKVEDADDVIVSTGFAVLRSKEGLLNPDYLLHSVLGLYVEKQIYGLVVGSNYPAINSKDVRSLRVPLPPLPEQQKIANILSTWDKAIDSLQKLIDKKQERKKGLMQQLLTGRKRFPEFVGSGEMKKTKLGWIPEDWLICKFNKLFATRQGIQCAVEDQRLQKEEGMVRFIRIIDITSSNEPPRFILNPGQKHLLESEDLFMVRYGSPGLIGQGYKGVIANNMFRLIPLENVDKGFYKYFFLSQAKVLKSLASSSTMPALNFTALNSMNIVRPTLEEQQRIASILTGIDAEIEKLQTQLNKLLEQKKGLMQKLLTGEVRVKTDIKAKL